MSKLVIELQQLAADGSISVAELLRRARIVASKLNLAFMNKWIESEMHGYGVDDTLPDYRVIKGDLVARNPVTHRLMPLRFDPKVTQNISTIPMRDSIGRIVELASSPEAQIEVHFDNEVEHMIRSMTSPFHQQWIVPFVRLYGSQLLGVLDTVRSKILDWSLDLESKGILGENMSFSDAEKKAASTNLTITNFSGNLNAISNSTVSSSKISQSNKAVAKGDVESLIAHLRANGIGDSDLDELRNAITEDSKTTNGLGEKVLAWMGKINFKAATGEIATGAAGNLIATAIQAFLGLG